VYSSYLADLQSDMVQDNAVAPAPTTLAADPVLLPVAAEPNIVLPGGITIPRKVAIGLLLAAIGLMIWYIKSKKK
jgi:hypothetical protein